MADQLELSFGGLLRRLRAEAKLTQEELAEAAGVSPRSVSDLERGINRTAHKETALLLSDALSLAGPVRALFVAAARGRGPAAAVLVAWGDTTPGAFAAAPTRALPRSIACFTGREAELDRLLGAVDNVAAAGPVAGIHAIDGMAGAGKTTFAVHAAHKLAPYFPDGHYFLPLHAHTPGQRPVEPADALASLLLTAGLIAGQIPSGLEARAARWRDHVADKKILLLLDDAAGQEQVRPLLPGTAGSLVLITSRRRLSALEDAEVISLGTLPRDDAVALLARLSCRPDLKSVTGPAEEITRLCGYLPLAIGILAGQLRHHPARTAADMAAQLAAARDRLAMMQAENLSVAAAFGMSYQNLTMSQQRLFHRLGLVPGPSVDAYAAAALDDISLDEARSDLDGLYDQNLVTEPASGRYQLHDLLREHARTLATADDPADSDAAVGRVLDYYLHAAAAAGRHFAPWTAAYDRPLTGRVPPHVPDLSTLGQAADWLETERPNLHAAVDYAAVRAWPVHATRIPHAMSDFLLAHGHWDQASALHQTALTMARQAGDRAGEADALNELGILRTQTGDYPAAAVNLSGALALYRDLGDRAGEAGVLNRLGIMHAHTSEYPAAVACHQQALDLARELGDRRGQASALNNIGLPQQMSGDYPAAVASHRQALDLARELGNQRGVAYALNALGCVEQLTGDYHSAATSQQQALALFCDLGEQIGQAYALNDLGVVQRLTKDYPAASASHQRAFKLFFDLGNRLGQAEALNNLGELSAETSDSNDARQHHTQALAIARSIGVPLEEARALEGLGHSYLQDRNPHEAVAHLRQALTIYQRIGAPAAQRVQETLRHLGL
ncbi:MAG TPA: helix-turn-helix transcriptional regulator [Streptosporangiaceae bacterium]|nr:helix-turn-helix transcriptional regulator [Streptosporangiaceae bacterium]